MKEDIILIGGGGHAKVMIDIIRSTNQYNIIGICDRQGDSVLGVPVIGDDSMLEALYKQGISSAFICVGGVGKPQIRWRLYQKLKQIGYKLPVLVHRTAWVAPSVVIDEGTCVMPGAMINADVKIGKISIINTGSIVEHDCQLGDNVHISPGACLCGEVQVGADTHIGAKAVINQGIEIGIYGVVGSGSVVIRRVGSSQKVVGNPARVLENIIDA